MERIKDFIDEHLYQILLGLVGVIVLLTVGLVFVGQKPASSSKALPVKTESVDVDKTSTSTESASQLNSPTKQAESKSSGAQLYVDVKGAVKHPGVYQVSKDMRVQDAVNLAGGFTRSVDKKQINLAGKLADQQVVYVPLRGEIKGNALAQGITPQEPQQASSSNATGADEGANPDASSGTGTESSGNNNSQINLNTADKTKLQELTGIGEKKAEQIINYRQTTGQFKRIEDLKNVPGFGDKTFANLKAFICV